MVLWAWLPKLKPEGERLTSGPDPVPVKLAICVLPAKLLLLSVTVKVAVRVPGAAGVNVTVMAQLPLAGTDPPQVLVCPKSLEFAPDSAMPLMVKAVFPVLFKVTACPALVEPRV